MKILYIMRKFGIAKNSVSSDNPNNPRIGVAKLQKFNVKLLEGDDKGEVVEIDLPIYKE